MTSNANFLQALGDWIGSDKKELFTASTGRDMGGPWLIIRMQNEYNEEWESYTISAERIN